jgi:hypothetical protein
MRLILAPWPGSSRHGPAAGRCRGERNALASLRSGGCPRGESSVGKTTGATGAIAGTNMIAMKATTIAVAIGATNVRAGGIFFALTERHGIHRAVRACGFIARPSTQVGAKQCVVLQPPKRREPRRVGSLC